MLFFVFEKVWGAMNISYVHIKQASEATRALQMGLGRGHTVGHSLFAILCRCCKPALYAPVGNREQLAPYIILIIQLIMPASLDDNLYPEPVTRRVYDTTYMLLLLLPCVCICIYILHHA